MRIRESGMPVEKMWSAFFNVEHILDELQINNTVHNVLEVGSGYGTFSISASRRITGTFFAMDIDQRMIDIVKTKAIFNLAANIEFLRKDFLAENIEIRSGAIDYLMMFNILHHSQPEELFAKSKELLTHGGRIGIIHWRSDIETPRGPDLSIRPKPEQCLEWAIQYGFRIIKSPFILEPYHYGLIIEKP